MKFPIIFIFTLLLKSNSIGQNYETEISSLLAKCLYGNSESYKDNFGEIIQIPLTRGGAYIPNSFSLKEFVPEVLQQDEGSCVSYATAYYGWTVYKRYNNKNMQLEPYDPLYLYGRIHSFYNLDSTRDEGSSIPKALTFLRDFGNPVKYPPYKRSYENPLKQFEEKLIYFAALSNSPSQIDKIKYCISAGNPVVVSMSTNLSLATYKLQRLKKYRDSTELNNKLRDIFITKFREEDKSFTDKELKFEYEKLMTTNEYCWSGKYPKKGEGCHAMCIVGYDDKKFGGAFEIVNSWDKDWANDGFIWVKYTDLYQMYPSFYKIGK
jgi:hypothetical protein